MPKKLGYYICKCGDVSGKIGISSVCTQTLDLKSGDYTNTDVGDTLHGFCLECGAIIPNKRLKTLTGLIATEQVFQSCGGK